MGYGYTFKADNSLIYLCLVDSSTILIITVSYKKFLNSVDPDQTPRSASYGTLGIN